MTDEFEEIANEVSERAANVKCSVERYCSGLRLLIDRLQTDLAAAGDVPESYEDDDCEKGES